MTTATRRDVLAGAAIGAGALIGAQRTIADEVQPSRKPGVGGTDPGPRNLLREQQDPDMVNPPPTDHDTSPNLRFTYADSHIRQEGGGWTRQITERELGVLRRGISFIEQHRLSSGLLGLFQGLGGRCAPPVHVVDHLRRGEEGEGGRKAGREFGRSPQQRLRIAVRLSCRPKKQLPPAHEAIVRFQIVDMFDGKALSLAGAEIERKRGDDLGRDVVLHGEDVGQVPVVPLGPQVSAGRRVDELRGDPDPGSRFPHAPLEDMAHAEALPDLRHEHVLAFERER